MKPRNDINPRGEKEKRIQGEGPNWMLIAGGALLSTLSIHLGYKLKQMLNSKQCGNASSNLEGVRRSNGRRRLSGCRMHSSMYSFERDDDGCFNCIPEREEAMAAMKEPLNDQLLSEPDVSLPLVRVPTPEFGKETGVTWASSPDRLELPPRPFHHSNCSDSPCVSESGSDIFSKREVIQKLRQQLKRRDDMIIEMQDQIVELQNSLNAQMTLSTNLQSQIDATHRDLFDSEREIQRLRKAIADHCVKHVGTNDKPSGVSVWPSEATNGHSNGFLDGDSNLQSLKQEKVERERIEMLKREIGELREVLEGKDYLLQSYKVEKAELSTKIMELQQRLDSQLPSIL